jgi:ubiquinone/menaquinone biosynthesis C-methylase UbiE
MKLTRRSNEDELMDHEGTNEEITSALKELKRINKFLGGNSISSDAIFKIRRNYKLDKIKVLDAGSGTSDIMKIKRLSGLVNLTTLDKNYLICRLLKEEKSSTDITCGDVLNFPFRHRSFDVVHASLFLHHFNDSQIPILLNRLCRSAVYAVIINDLRRSYLAYYGFKLISTLFSRNRLVKNDGLVSVKRAFKKNELVNFLNRTGWQYEIKKRWAFRWSIIIYCYEDI